MCMSIWFVILVGLLAVFGGASSRMQLRLPSCQSWAQPGLALRTGQTVLHTTAVGCMGMDDVIFALNLRGGGMNTTLNSQSRQGGGRYAQGKRINSTKQNSDNDGKAGKTRRRCQLAEARLDQAESERLSKLKIRLSHARFLSKPGVAQSRPGLGARPVRLALCSSAANAGDGGGIDAEDKVAKAKKRLVKAERELDAAQEADPVDAQRVAKAELGVTQAELGVAKAELKAAPESEKAKAEIGVAKAELGVAKAELKAAPESEKAKAELGVTQAELGVAEAKWQAAPEIDRVVLLASVETARMAYEKALNSTTATPLQDRLDLASYKFVQKRILDPQFNCDGFGPFTLERKELRNGIIEFARSGQRGRDGTVHITSCRASGKTILLLLVGEDLSNAGETVYFFPNSQGLNSVLGQIMSLDKLLKQRVFFLVDETQASVDSEAFTFLLKSAVNIVTIGAGLPHFPSTSGHFKHRFQTSDLLLKDVDLKNEGVFEYFVGNHASKVQVCELVSYLCQETGGSVYPLMRLAELLVPDIKNGVHAKDQIAHYGSHLFRESKEFKSVCGRILPAGLDNINVLKFLCSGAAADGATTQLLASAGFVDRKCRILSFLLFEAYLATLGTKTNILRDLREGVDGTEQILMFGLPRMEWKQYDGHAGPIEDALTVELLMKIAELPQVSSRLFNPKLICAGNAARRPDMFFNDKVNTYVEALVTVKNNKEDQEKLDNRISRFYKPEDPQNRHYLLPEGKHWAVLNFQMFDAPPVKPSHDSHLQVFEKHVFTFVMPTKQIFRGSKCIGSGHSSVMTSG